MATTGFPKVPAKAWRTLRARAIAAPSTKFTPSLVSAQLDMASPESARRNIVVNLERLGLIDDSGALTELGQKWRSDASYADACQEMLDATYPSELASLTTDDGSLDARQVRRWFDQKGFGTSNAKQMAATYLLIAAKDSQVGAAPKAPKPPLPAGQQSVTTRRVRKKEPEVDADPVEDESRVGPRLHLDVQIHIPADATAEQIDRIFASMAKHLYGS